MVIVRDILNIIESFAPASLAESWDNVGLLLGSEQSTVHRIVVCLDATEETVDYAILQQAELIVSHHPMIFDALKYITDQSVIGKNILRLAQAGISVIAAHTNLDCAEGGINEYIAQEIGLADCKPMISAESYKLRIFVPKTYAQVVWDAIMAANDEIVEHYSHCSFLVEGMGTFLPHTGSNAFIGHTGQLEKVEEVCIECTVSSHKLNAVKQAIRVAHPYEQPVIDIYELKNAPSSLGLGQIGQIEEQSLSALANTLIRRFGLTGVHIARSGKETVKKVAVFCGACGSEYLRAVKAGCDVLITGEMKHFETITAAQAGLNVIKMGHFESENLYIRKLSDKMREQLEYLHKDAEVLQLNANKYNAVFYPGGGEGREIINGKEY